MPDVRFYLHPVDNAIFEWHTFVKYAGNPYPMKFYWSQMTPNTGAYGYMQWPELSSSDYPDVPYTYPTNFFARYTRGSWPDWEYRKSAWITQSNAFFEALTAADCNRIAAGQWTFALYYNCSVDNPAVRTIRIEVHLLRDGGETELFNATTNDLKTYDGFPSLQPLIFTVDQPAFEIEDGDRLVVKAFFEKVKDDGHIDGANKITMGWSGTGSTQHSYVEFPAEMLEAEPSPSPNWIDEGNLLAPVAAAVRLNTAKTMYSATGHEPKHLLDNNPDTYWKPASTADHTLWFDLGEEIRVDAFAFRLHNYNAGLGALKTWRLSYLTDGGYIYFDDKLFTESRNAGVPLIAFVFEIPVVARYWKLQLLDFDETPSGPLVEIGGVWFMRDYSLPYDNQYPEPLRFEWGNDLGITRSGSGYQERRFRGHVRTSEKEYVFVQQADSDLLLNAFKASKGGLLPVAFKPDYDSIDWILCRFISDHSLQETWSEVFQPRMEIREIGFKRVPYTTKTLPTLSTTVAHWKFDESLADSSGKTLSIVDILAGAAYDYGVCSHDKTCFVFDEDGLLELVDNDLDMGTSSFSIELIFATAPVSESTYLVRKIGDNPSPAPSPEPSPSPVAAGYSVSLTTAGKIDVVLGDGTNEVAGSGYGSGLHNGSFHYLAVTVDRTLDLLKVYVDGSQAGSSLDISAITGAITNAIEPFQIGGENLSGKKCIIGLLDEVCVSKQLLSATLIASRHAGYSHDGSWRL